MEIMRDTFYFVVYAKDDNGDKSVTVIDLSHSVSYERSDWDCVSDVNHDDLREALDSARALSILLGIPYIVFDSRYDDSLNERIDQYGHQLNPGHPYMFESEHITGFEVSMLHPKVYANKGLGFYFMIGTTLPDGSKAENHCFWTSRGGSIDLENCHNITPLSIKPI